MRDNIKLFVFCCVLFALAAYIAGADPIFGLALGVVIFVLLPSK